MSKINKKKITDLPVAETTEGLLTLGVDNTGKSVQVSINQLKGNKGDKGDAPVVGANGNWWIEGIDTGKPARGEDGTNIAYKVAFNVSQYNNVFNYTDQATARNAVPANFKGLGQQITYKLASGKWVNEQYTGTDVSGWTTVTNWKTIGEVTSEQMSLKADKALAEGSPITYFKSGSGSGGFIDLTDAFKATFMGVEPTALVNWFIRSSTRTNLRVTKNSDPSDLTKQVLGFIKLKNNTTYEVSGLANPMSKFSTLMPGRNERNVYTSASDWTSMPPIAWTTTGDPSSSNVDEYIYGEGYSNKFRFTTKSSGTVYLCMWVKMNGTATITDASNSSVVYTYSDWLFDSMDSVTLHEITGNPITGGDSLVDSHGTQVKSLNFESIVSEKLNEIDGISAGGSSYDRPNLIPVNPTFVDRYQIKKDGSIQYISAISPEIPQYISDYIPVKGGESYEIGRTILSVVGSSERRRVNQYTSDKQIIPNDDLNELQPSVSVTRMHPDCAFIRINITRYNWNRDESNRYIKTNYPVQITTDRKVDISVSDLSDAQETTVGGVDGVILPKLFIPKANIIDGGGGPDNFKLSMRNLTTFVGSFNTALDKIHEKYPQARHVFVSHYTYDGNQGNGYLEKLIATQKSTCANRQIAFINLADIMGITNKDSNKIDESGTIVNHNNLFNWTQDGLHPGITDGNSALADALTYALTDKLRFAFGNNWTGKIVANIGTSISAGLTFNGGLANWAQFINRALTALGATVKLYAYSGGCLRGYTSEGGVVTSSFMRGDISTWNFKNQILDKIGTSEQPHLYVWEMGYNDYVKDPADFKLNW